MNNADGEHKKTNRGATSDEPHTAPSGGTKGNPAAKRKDSQSAEVGGRRGPDPVRYGDWEKNGRCIDF